MDVKKEVEALKEKILAEAKDVVGDIKQAAQDFFTLEVVILTDKGELVGKSELDIITGDQKYTVPANEHFNWPVLDTLKEMNAEALHLREVILSDLGKLLNITSLIHII